MYRKVDLTISSELSQQMCPHAKYHVHGALRQAVLLTEGFPPTVSVSLLPGLGMEGHRAVTDCHIITGTASSWYQ